MTRATIKTAAGVTASAVDATPSEQIQQSAGGIAYETDARGRRIGIVKPSAIIRFRLFKVLGKDASNEQMVGNAMLACLVREINGRQVNVLNSYREIEGMIEELDDDGFAAIVKGLRDQFGMVPPSEEEEDETKRNL